MEQSERKTSGIGEGNACILVKDSSLRDMHAPFWSWLDEHGFSKWSNHGYYDSVDWVWINLNSKVYAPGMPGIKITSCICDHAVKISEFQSIWSIFEQYAGLQVLEMERNDGEGTSPGTAGSR